MADYDSAGFDTLYPTLLGLNTGGITGSLKTVQDGTGTDTALQVSTGAVKSLGTLESVGSATIGGNVTATQFSGSAAGLTDVHNTDFAIRTASSGAALIGETDQVINLTGTVSSLVMGVAADLVGKRFIVNNLTAGSISIDFNSQTIFNNGAASTSGLSVRAYTGYVFLATALGWVLLDGTLV